MPGLFLGNLCPFIVSINVGTTTTEWYFAEEG